MGSKISRLENSAMVAKELAEIARVLEAINHQCNTGDYDKVNRLVEAGNIDSLVTGWHGMKDSVPVRNGNAHWSYDSEVYRTLTVMVLWRDIPSNRKEYYKATCKATKNMNKTTAAKLAAAMKVHKSLRNLYGLRNTFPPIYGRENGDINITQTGFTVRVHVKYPEV